MHTQGQGIGFNLVGNYEACSFKKFRSNIDCFYEKLFLIVRPPKTTVDYTIE